MSSKSGLADDINPKSQPQGRKISPINSTSQVRTINNKDNKSGRHSNTKAEID